MKQKGIESRLSNQNYPQYSQEFFQGKGQIKLKTQSLLQLIYRSSKLPNHFLRRFKIRKSRLKALPNAFWCSETIKGTLNEISAKQFDNDISEFDVIPLIGYSAVVKEIAKATKAEIKLNEEVIKIDYQNPIIKVETKNHMYLSKRVISSLPLGVLQSGLVEFNPKIPENYKMNLSKIGVAKVYKLFVSFEEPFWDISKALIYFLSKDKQIKYPLATSIVKEGKYILCIFPSVSQNAQISSFNEQELLEDLLVFLKKYNLKTEIKIRCFKLSQWTTDPFALGGYSFFKVGQTPNVDELRKPIDNKIWFIGEYCHPQMNGYAHAAFQTGVWAAEEIINQIKKQV